MNGDTAIDDLIAGREALLAGFDHAPGGTWLVAQNTTHSTAQATFAAGSVNPGVNQGVDHSVGNSVKNTDNSVDSYFWIMIGMLMLFVLAFLMVLKQVRKARLAAYPEFLSGFTDRYKRNSQRQLID